MSFDNPRLKGNNTISSGSLESKNTTSGSISLSESNKFRKLQRKRSEIVSNSLRGSIPLLPDNLFPNLPQFKQVKQIEKRTTQKSLPSVVVTSKALTLAENRRAKTVFFYRDGDEYFTGVRVPISKGRFRTMDALMDSLNESIPMPFGVRRLHTPSGKTPIRSLDDLKPHGRYIAASSTRRVQGVDLEAVERRKRHREDAQRRWNFQNSPTTHGGNTANNTMQIIQINPKSGTSEINRQDPVNNQREQMLQTTSGGTVLRSRIEKLPAAVEVSSSLGNQQRINTFMPITSKQIYFVLNGNPHRVYRTLVSPLRKGEIDQLLEEISAGLHVAIFRIYSFEGDRILNVEQLLQLKDSRAIAVPRHERLILNGQTNSDILRPVIPIQPQKQQPVSLLLPPIINGNNKKSNGSSSKSVPPYRGHRSKNRQPSNNIDRLPAYENLSSNNIARFESNNVKKKRILNSTNSIDDNDHKLIKTQEETSIRQRSFSSNNAPSLVSSTLNSIKIKRKLTTIEPTNTININADNTTTNTSSTNTTTTTTDSDSGRPRSAMEELENMATEENEIGEIKENEEDDGDEEDDYPEEPPELKALHQVIGKGKSYEEGENREKEEIDEEKKEDERMNYDEVEKENSENIDIVEIETQQTINNEIEDDIVKDDYLEEPSNLEELSEFSIYNDNNRDEEVEEIKRVEENRKIKENAQKREKITTKTDEEKINNNGKTEQKDEGNLSGVYSVELERILYGQAAIKIQSAWRGYNARKGFKHTRFSDHPTYIGTGSYGQRRRSKNNLYKPNERHQAIVTRVKTPISAKRGPPSFKMKSSTTMLVPDYGNETAHDSSSDREEASVTELLQGKHRLGWEMSQEQNDKSPVHTQRTPRTDYLYTITVITGNRWAADTEADLYVVMHGTGGLESERLWLRQEFTNWLQSGTNGQRFRQNHSDSFQFRVPSRLGILKKLTVGHDCKGYGAGIFIDRVMVTEDEEATDDCRQFLFLCNKWLDSGQVDGKLERTIRLNSFYEISSIPIEDRVTKGRWELILHGGSEKGLGGTTSQLSITGYGTRAQSTTSGLYDSNMAKVPSDALIQLDFGDIGELLKVRIEIDGTGESPDYFLNFVEFKDLDTEERFVVMCGKWLKWKSTKKGDQPFRELSAFHIGVEPLPLITYEGKISVQLMPPRIECFKNEEIFMDLHGDLGETGAFRMLISPTNANKEKHLKSGDEENIPIILDNEDSEAIDIPFKVEAVSIGRVLGARLRFEPNKIGEQIVDGLLTIQNIFQKQGLWPLASNSEFLCGRIVLRESYHTPYRYILTRSQFHELSDKTHICTKEMLTTEMEGVSTRLPRRKQKSKEKSNWLLQISLSYGSTLLPEIELCGENGSNIRLRPLNINCPDGMLSYQYPPQSTQSFSEKNELFPLRKIRIFIEDENKKVIGLENIEEETTLDNKEEQKSFTIIEKIRICDSVNGDELRFPSADCHLQKYSVYELSAIWPDRSPIPIVIYLIRIVAGAVTTQNISTITVRLNISGEYGDVGWRTLNNSENENLEKSSDDNQQIQLFASNTRNSFEFEAVSIGHLDLSEMEVFCSDEAQDFSWECSELLVTDTNTALYYRFKFDSPFSTNCRFQRCQTLL